MKKLITCILAGALIFISCEKKQMSKSAELQKNEEEVSFEEKPKIRTVEIASIEYSSNVLPSDIAALKAKIVEGLSNRCNVRVIDRSRMNDVLSEHQSQQSLWASDDGRAEVGRQYNANALVYLEAISKTEIQVTIEDLDTFQQVVKLVNMSNVSEIAAWDLSILSL